jgi:hypothetical protein
LRRTSKIPAILARKRDSAERPVAVAQKDVEVSTAKQRKVAFAISIEVARDQGVVGQRCGAKIPSIWRIRTTGCVGPIPVTQEAENIGTLEHEKIGFAIAIEIV